MISNLDNSGNSVGDPNGGWVYSRAKKPRRHSGHQCDVSMVTFCLKLCALCGVHTGFLFGIVSAHLLETEHDQHHEANGSSALNLAQGTRVINGKLGSVSPISCKKVTMMVVFSDIGVRGKHSSETCDGPKSTPGLHKVPREHCYRGWDWLRDPETRTNLPDATHLPNLAEI